MSAPETPPSLLSSFDKVLIAGLGCSLIGICLLAGGFWFVWRNPPQRRLDTPVTPPVTVLPTLPGAATTFPTLTPFVTPSPTPTPLPGFGNGLPPAGKIVFTCFVNGIDQICLIGADGTGRKQLTNFNATAFYASISPDGETILFVSRRSGNFEIYSMDLNGGQLERLTSGIGSLFAPEYSPNGEKIVFANAAGGSQSVWVMKKDGTNAHSLTDNPFDDVDPTWSPDGSMIAFASSRS
ncbi:MAG: TolB family protein [Anaerolineales bacterium]